MSEESEEGVTVLWQGGKLQESELPKALNLDNESCVHLRLTHSKQAQHCTDLPRQVTFPAHTEENKETKKDKRRKEKRKRENRPPIL